MSVRVTIETASKAEAQLIADGLPRAAEASSWRGLGVVRLGTKNKAETRELVESVSRSFREHGLRWARVRCDDEEFVFKMNGSGHGVG